MMEKNPSRQLELFSDPQGDTRLPSRGQDKNSFSRYIWGYEKTILIIIAILVTGIVSFSVGVERGRRLSKSQPLQAQDSEVRTEVAQAQIITEDEEEPQPATIPVSGYTVQVASFKTNVYAQKEVALLKKRGYKAVTLKKGEHIILCVGNFPGKEEAQALLSELNRYYKDCRIRRL
ncbi:MAG: Sporulation related domain protein [Candidatus Omnitrophica bacterium ADurb.Bin205]|nr:MAG: Sporulation related domain protein [Candidatus Omnitrophica bacterium ADurb.Bin205]